MIRTIYRHRSGTIVMDMPCDQIPSAVRDPQARLWIDVVAGTPEEQNFLLKETFNFHPLAIEDAVHDVHVPKVDDYGAYLYLVLHKFIIGDERMDIDTAELDVFLGSNYLITLRAEAGVVMERLWNEEYHRTRGLARGPAYLLAEVLDRQVDSYIPLLDQFEEQVERLGDQMFLNSDDLNKLLSDLLTAKSTALRLYRILMPQREVLDRLSRGSYAAVPTDSRIYFQDVYDHLVRLADLAEGMRDLTSSTIATYLALANNRMNEIVKVLTIISTIFIPLTFLAGVYGMNFRYMPELGTRWAYPLIWLVFIAIAGGLLYIFHRRKWL